MNKRLSLLIAALAVCSCLCAEAMRPYKTPVQTDITPLEEEIEQQEDAPAAPAQIDTTLIVQSDDAQEQEAPAAVRPDIRPAPLKSGDCIGIFVISNYVDSTALLYGVSVF